MSLPNSLAHANTKKYDPISLPIRQGQRSKLRNPTMMMKKSRVPMEATPHMCPSVSQGFHSPMISVIRIILRLTLHDWIFIFFNILYLHLDQFFYPWAGDEEEEEGEDGGSHETILRDFNYKLRCMLMEKSRKLAATRTSILYFSLYYYIPTSEL